MKHSYICSCKENQFIVDSLIQRYHTLNSSQVFSFSKSLYSYKKIIKSITLYPLPIESKEDALLLDGIGMQNASIISKMIKDRIVDEEDNESDKENNMNNENVIKKVRNTTKRRRLNKKERIVESEYVLPIDECAISLLNDYSEDNNNIIKDNFELILLVDNREMRSKEDRTYIHTHLLNRKINCRTCQLPLGDYQWIIKDKRSGIEILTDYIIERKTSDDLIHSIFDGRYNEQKYRLKNSGLHHIIYLIEGSIYSQDKVPKETLESSIIHTEIKDGFMIERTVSIDGTIEFLSTIHNIIANEMKNNKIEDLCKNVLSNPPTLFVNYCEYIKSMKDLKLKEYFGQQLSQIKGMGVLQVKNVIDKYPTPFSLRNEYRNIKNLSLSGEFLLYDNSNHFVNKKNSESVYNVFNTD